MKFLLICLALNLNMEYADEATCRVAQEELKANHIKSICIPAEVDKGQVMFNDMLEFIAGLQAMENAQEELETYDE